MNDRTRPPLPYHPEREFREETGVLVFHDVPEMDWLTKPEALRVETWQDEMEATRARSAELARMPYAEYLKSEEWRRLRRLVKTRANHRCERCGQRDQVWNVHHLTYERRGFENLEDLVLLCRSCHGAEHGIAGEGHAV